MTEKITKNVEVPGLSSLLDIRIRKGLEDLNCILIGTIESFDSSLQTVSISINYKRKVGEEETKKEKEERERRGEEEKNIFLDYPLLTDCPVAIMSGGDSYLTFPIRAADPDNDIQGDTCIVMFCDRDIDAWFDSGQILAPNSTRIHSLSDGIALVGIRSKLNLLETYNEVRASLIDASGERLSQAGDTKTSFRTASHSGWLIMDGKTVGNADSGADYAGPQYEELFDILKESQPNAGSEVFEDDDTVIITDMRGRGAVGADNMGGSQANVLTAGNTPNRNVLGGDIGEEKHLLTGAESGTSIHSHPMPGKSGGALSSAAVFAHPDTETNDNPQNTGDSAEANASSSHNNVPPGAIMYWFIKI